MTSSNGSIFPRYWPFVRGIHRSPVNSPHKGQWRGALKSSLICVWINGRVNNREAGDLRRNRAHYDVIVMITFHHYDCSSWLKIWGPFHYPIFYGESNSMETTFYCHPHNNELIYTNLERDMIDVLSRHEQNFVAIWYAGVELKGNEFRSNHSWITMEMFFL